MDLTYEGPDGTPLKMGVEPRVLAKIEFEPMSGHWLWRGNLTPRAPLQSGGEGKGGYGRVSYREAVQRAIEAGIAPKGSRDVLIHRYVYWCWCGEIPVDSDDGKLAVLDHDESKCADRLHHCCNPLHMTPVSPRLNTARGLHARLHSEQEVLFSGEKYEEGRLF